MVIPITKKLSCIRVVRSVQSKGFKSLKRPLHTSTNDEDDFAELGLPVEKGGCMIPKLMTKKPEPSTINVLELEEAISFFGKVSKASKRSVPNRFDYYDIEFKSVESSRTQHYQLAK